jgi:hypothetical protein
MTKINAHKYQLELTRVVKASLSFYPKLAQICCWLDVNNGKDCKLITWDFIFNLILSL